VAGVNGSGLTNDMETFDFAVLNDVPGEPELRAIVTQFGDGYEQISEEGINNVIDKITLNCVFSPSQVIEADRLKDFLTRHGSAKVFLWQKPWETTTKKWRIESYNQATKSSSGSWIHTFTIKLKQSFRP
jgi:phage-related protein